MLMLYNLLKNLSKIVTCFMLVLIKKRSTFRGYKVINFKSHTNFMLCAGFLKDVSTYAGAEFMLS